MKYRTREAKRGQRKKEGKYKTIEAKRGERKRERNNRTREAKIGEKKSEEIYNDTKDIKQRLRKIE